MSINNASNSHIGEAKKKIIVIGAGISGLTAAYRLQKEGFRVTVLESSDHVGGRANTVYKDGYTIDTGAGMISETYYAYKELAQEIGLLSEIVPSSQYIGIIRNRVIHYLHTSNVYFSGITTGLLSWGAKCRLVLAFWDVYRAKKRGELTYTDLTRAAPLDYETAQQYSERRLNSELSDYFCEPIVRGMMLANADKISKVELMHGINNIFDVSCYGLRGGVNVFPQRLASHLDVTLNAVATSVRAVEQGVEVSWQVGEQQSTDQLTEQFTEKFDGCVVACPLPAAAKIYPEHTGLQQLNSKLKFGRCISVVIGTQVRPKSKAYILEVPRKESEEVCFMFLEHNKGADSAPEGRGLIMMYLEDETSARLMDASEEQILAEVLPFVEQVFPEVAGTVEMTHITRWSAALPVNEVGAYQLVADFNATLSEDSPIQFACDYMMAAVGQSIAVECGNKASSNLIKCFKG